MTEEVAMEGDGGNGFTQSNKATKKINREEKRFFLCFFVPPCEPVASVRSVPVSSVKLLERGA
jgi:hypothetical protein